MKTLWHSLPLPQVLKLVQSSAEGLTSDEAARRLAERGKNVLPSERGYSRLRLFLSQFQSPLIAILLLAAGISLYLEHYSDAIFIAVVLFINTTVAFYQENKANRSLAALKRAVAVYARVLRDGRPREVKSEELAPGDVVLFRAGDKISADLRVLEARGARFNESTLTGEWGPVVKEAGELSEKTPLAERSNMLFAGTFVEEGEGQGIVVATGVWTEYGTIVELLRETPEGKTPLQKNIASLSRLVGVFVFVVTLLIIGLGFAAGRDFGDILVAALALSVSAIPAGILPAITVILVLGMRRILKEHGLVRKLIANETLGSVTVIATDKTGTLTQGSMEVSRILTGSRELLGGALAAGSHNGLESHIVALKIAVLTNDAFVENPDAPLERLIVRGRPTERAFLLAGAHAGLWKDELEKEHQTLERQGFDSVVKYAASLHAEPHGARRVQVIGAPEAILAHTVSLEVDGRAATLDSHEYTELLKKFESLTERGFRVIACAYRRVPAANQRPLSELIGELTLVGFIALQDPVRLEAKDSIAETRRAGIRTLIITGDHRLTARSIALEVGLSVQNDQVIEGVDIDRMNEAELADRLRTIVICARVSPAHKLRLVEALKRNGEVVAMVGDGINDAPALKAADVGVAVGSGTDVAKEVADIVLLDNNFRTIVKAVEQGRVIFQNIRKVSIYLIADDFSQLFIFFGAMAFGLPLPLLAAQILWINLVEDGFPDIALTTEQETAGVMERPPRRVGEPIFNGELKRFMLAVFAVTGVAAFSTYLFLLDSGRELSEVRTILFTLMGFDSLLFAYVVRSFHRPLWRRSIFSNQFLNTAALFGVGLLFIAVYTPFFQRVLSTVPIGLDGWLIAVLVGIVEIVVLELAKRRIFAA